MSQYLHKSHNVSVLLYHLVCPAKYRRAVFDEKVDYIIRDICLDISRCYEIQFLEIGTDKDHVHFLIQAIPIYSPTKIVTIIKSITAKEVFQRAPHVKKKLWGGEFWSDKYFINTVGQHGTESVIMNYIKNQGKEQEYTQLYQQPLPV